MVGQKRIIWKIVVGIILVLVMGKNLALYQGGSPQSNTGLSMSVIAIVGGFYLIYRGLYPHTK